MKCRSCQSKALLGFVDLGFAPPSNSYLAAADLTRPEQHYPLRVNVCENCWLVQTEDYAKADEFFSASYAYFSSTSQGWLDHARRYCLDITQKLKLGKNSFVVEIASNDGYLLRNFVSTSIPCLGIEPTASTAKASKALGIETLQEFFGEALAGKLVEEGRAADLIVGNNVFAHVPDINDFTSGIARLLKPQGVVTLEFPHLLNLVKLCQFDTIYHEHYSYLSLSAVQRIFARAHLRIFDVEELPTHGGSLRIYGCRDNAAYDQQENVQRVVAEEQVEGLEAASTYATFQKRSEKIKNDVLAFLIEAKRKGKRVAAYGAAAKGNTLLNFAGVRPDLVSFVCDAAVAKQGKFMPASHIPILPPEALKNAAPDYVLILPWNIKAEVIEKTRPMLPATTRYVVAVPELEVL